MMVKWWNGGEKEDDDGEIDEMMMAKWWWIEDDGGKGNDRGKIMTEKGDDGGEMLMKMEGKKSDDGEW
jgi:hypothetical protein